MKSRLGFSLLALGFAATELAAANPPAYLPVDDFTCPVLATCVSGPCSTVTFRDLQYCHAATPGNSVTWAEPDPCQLPRATCSAPPAAQVLLIGHVVSVDQAPVSAPSVDALLQAWERQSCQQEPISERDRRWVERMSQANLNAHALDLALTLSGPVKLAELKQQFVWQCENSPAATPRLLAVPRDETQRLFCPALRITLSQKSHQLLALEVTDNSARWASVLLPPSTEVAVSHSADLSAGGLPPSPLPVAVVSSAPLIRFAAGIVEIEDGPQ